MSEEHVHSSIEEAGGAATGFTGTIENWNADAEARFADTLMEVGKFVQGESGCLLGHIKAAVFKDDGNGLTLNLIDMDNGVEHHGTLARNDLVKFNFMCAVLDVDEDELQHFMLHAIDDSGLDYHIDIESLRHHHEHHHHDEECTCGHHHHHDESCPCHGHEHEHHHHHDESECTCGHHDHHDEDCPCHEHEHEHEHHHDGGCCHHHHDE
ncbi:hypothetical protein TALC_00956 [Thermoplasmatales archaeon BRNA1]|nr:hypothetical protein TALC_00956 [Thermoplasmatales archaeon BRNA1]